MQDSEARQVRLAAAFVRSRAAPSTVGVVLGSGLGAFGDELGDVLKVPYALIPDMPRSTVVGHAGNLCLGEVSGVRVACLQGRVHAYEGHTLSRVAFGVRLLAELGCQSVLLTNAAGGIAANLTPGALMLITDHINLMGDSPLTGPNYGSGPRFPDLTQAYDRELADAALAAARAGDLELHSGVYAALRGPSYETPAEIRMLRTLGADAVGMSTVPEVIALRQIGLKVAAVSCITNLAAGISPRPLDHAEVETTARRTRTAFVGLLSRWVKLAAELT
ncbi:MAG TPA: purine-nucleoside phosphorylase [Polyangiaceae bacterium]|jgi:purine-nucleoside phosphorylase